MNYSQLFSLVIIFIGYIGAILEHKTHLKKSIAMGLAATVLWFCLPFWLKLDHYELVLLYEDRFFEFSELFFFIFVAMSYVIALEEFGFFKFIQAALSRYHLSTRKLFWIVTSLAFFLSPLLDNLTTALLMGQLLLSFARSHRNLIQLGFIGIVIAANAGGVFSPFGDITSLMIWQEGHIQFLEFFPLFIPSLVTYLIPAFALSRAIHDLPLTERQAESIWDHWPAISIFMTFMGTILFTLIAEHAVGFPPVFGMLAGLMMLAILERTVLPQKHVHTDIFKRMGQIDFDTILFFYGLTLAVEALQLLNILELMARFLYQTFPEMLMCYTPAWQLNLGHIFIGLLSAIIDNIPMMAAVLKMNLNCSLGSWQLLTLTTGVGGSLLSLGSAAGIGLMGLAPKEYNFQKHLKWTPIILIGYFGGVASHFILNAKSFL